MKPRVHYRKIGVHYEYCYLQGCDAVKSEKELYRPPSISSVEDRTKKPARFKKQAELYL
jgi:hypothetical protein